MDSRPLKSLLTKVLKDMTVVVHVFPFDNTLRNKKLTLNHKAILASCEDGTHFRSYEH